MSLTRKLVRTHNLPKTSQKVKKKITNKIDGVGCQILLSGSIQDLESLTWFNQKVQKNKLRRLLPVRVHPTKCWDDSNMAHFQKWLLLLFSFWCTGPSHTTHKTRILYKTRYETPRWDPICKRIGQILRSLPTLSHKFHYLLSGKSQFQCKPIYWSLAHFGMHRGVKIEIHRKYVVISLRTYRNWLMLEAVASTAEMSPLFCNGNSVYGFLSSIKRQSDISIIGANLNIIQTHYWSYRAGLWLCFLYSVSRLVMWPPVIPSAAIS